MNFLFLWMCIKESNYLLFKRGLRLFKDLCLLFLPNVPGAMFIQGGTFIPDSRVDDLNSILQRVYFVHCTFILHSVEKTLVNEVLIIAFLHSPNMMLLRCMNTCGWLRCVQGASYQYTPTLQTYVICIDVFRRGGRIEEAQSCAK